MEMQKEFIRNSELQLQRDVEKAEVFWKDTPLKLVDETVIHEKLASLGTKANFIDPEFAPGDSSIQHPSKGLGFDRVIQWRRPQDFLVVDSNRGLNEPEIFYKVIEPSDVIPGQLGDDWFLSGIACLSERPALIERLFVT